MQRIAIAVVFAWLAAGRVFAAEEVLTIEEAALLLRVPAETVRTMALAGRIPARDLGGQWRLSRSALLEWLGARGQALSAGELSAVSARGMASNEMLAQAGAGTVPGTIGEKPTAPTAEEVALREQGALLRGGLKTLELGFLYGRSERETFPISRSEARVYGATLTGRYGIKDNLQITARLPWIYRQNKVQLGTPGATSPQSESVGEHYVGDLSLSLLGVAGREAMGRPNVIWTLDSFLPTGPGDRGLGAGIVVSKSYDPLVLFSGFSYMRGLSIDPGNARRQLARDNWRLNLGYAYAINDSLALNGAFLSTYGSASLSPVAGAVPGSRERHQMQLGMTWMLKRGLFIEPTVAFGVGSASPDLTFSLNVPYTF